MSTWLSGLYEREQLAVSFRLSVVFTQSSRLCLEKQVISASSPERRVYNKVTKPSSGCYDYDSCPSGAKENTMNIWPQLLLP